MLEIKMFYATILCRIFLRLIVLYFCHDLTKLHRCIILNQYLITLEHNFVVRTLVVFLIL